MDALRLGRTPLRTVLRLSWPAMLEQILLSMASYVDTAMVGSIGAVATAAIAVNASTMWLIGGLLVSTGMGFTFLVARSIGAGDRDAARQSAQHAVIAAIAIGLLVTAVAEWIAPHLPRWLNARAEVAGVASTYMRIVASALLFQAFSAVFSSILRGAGDMKTPMRVNLTANGVNILLNSLLIFPAREVALFGLTIPMPGAGLGVAGAAIGTAGSYLVGGTLLLIAMFRSRTPIRLALRDRFRFKWPLLRDALSVGVPSALERSCLCFGQIALTAMITDLGTVQIAAHHLAVTAESISYLPVDGLAKCSTTLVGQSLGANKPDEAERFGKLVNRMGFIMTALGGLLLFTCAEPLIRIFTSDPAVIAEGRGILRLIAAAEPFFGLSIVISGALYGAGDAKYVFIVNAIGMWGVRLGLAWLFAYPLGLGLWGAWLAMGVDLIVRGVLYAIRFRRGKWKNAWRSRA